MKRIKIAILLVVGLFPITNVYAAGTASISVNDTVVNGNDVTATVTLRNMAAWNIKISCSGDTNGNSKKFSDDSGTGKDITKPLTLTCKATKLGKITFSYSGDITSSDGINKNVSGSKTVSVVKPREKSTNNNLKSLSVDGYSISPGFNKDTLEYTVNLESNVEKIKINASKEDGYASISGTGEKNVQEGDNKFEIIVTSETGKSKVYVLNAIVKDSNPIVKNVDGKSFTVVKRGSALTKPELFEDTTVTISETEIPAFYNEITKITLIGLKDGEGSIYLYKYDAKTDTCTKYETLTSTSKTIIFENTDEQIDGYVKTNMTINNDKYNVYQYPNNKDYALVYGMDLETGSKNWYLYNVKEMSIQVYMNDVVDDIRDQFNKQIEEYKVVLLCMVGLSLLLLIVIIIQIILKNKMKKKLLKKIHTLNEEIEQKKKDNEEINSKKKSKNNK